MTIIILFLLKNEVWSCYENFEIIIFIIKNEMQLKFLLFLIPTYFG